MISCAVGMVLDPPFLGFEQAIWSNAARARPAAHAQATRNFWIPVGDQLDAQSRAHRARRPCRRERGWSR